MGKGLYGDDVSAFDKKRATRDIAHAAPPGTGPVGKTCKMCDHLCQSRPRSGKVFRKCALMRKYWTHSYGTDIRCKDEACRYYSPKTEG